MYQLSEVQASKVAGSMVFVNEQWKHNQAHVGGFAWGLIGMLGGGMTGLKHHRSNLFLASTVLLGSIIGYSYGYFRSRIENQDLENDTYYQDIENDTYYIFI